MKRLIKFLPVVHQEKSCHIISFAFGLLFGIIGTIGKTELGSLMEKGVFSAGAGLIIGFFMALSTANNQSCTAKTFVSLVVFYVSRIAVISFLFMLIASVFR